MTRMTASKDACKVEHDLSEETYSKMIAFAERRKRAEFGVQKTPRRHDAFRGFNFGKYIVGAGSIPPKGFTAAERCSAMGTPYPDRWNTT